MKLLYILSTLDVLNFSLFIITFTPFVRSQGGSHSFMGIIGASNAFVSLLWNPIAGSLGDSSGRRSVLIKCLAISLIGNVISIFANNLPLIFITRLICSFGSPVGSTIKTIVTDVAKTPEEKSAAMNKMGALSGITFMFGSLTAGFINELPNGASVVFAIISVNVLIILLCAFQLENKIPKKSKKEKNAPVGLKKALLDLKEIDWYKYWDLFAIKGSIDLCYGIMQSNLGLILATVFEVKGRYMGYVMMLISVSGIVTNISMLKLKKLLYENDDGFQRIIHGAVLLVITFAGLGLSSVFSIFAIFIGTMTIARTMLDATLSDVLTNKTSDADKGAIVSLFESIAALTGIVSPLISGVLSDKFGEQVPITLCVVPAALAGLLAYSQQKKQEPVKED